MKSKKTRRRMDEAEFMARYAGCLVPYRYEGAKYLGRLIGSNFMEVDRRGKAVIECIYIIGSEKKLPGMFHRSKLDLSDDGDDLIVYSSGFEEYVIYVHRHNLM